MRCRYCCVGDKSKSHLISESQLYENLKWIAEYTLTNQQKEADIIFHGGEPTLLSAEIYDRVLKRITSEYEIQFKWKIQTNALQLTDAFLELFRKFHVSVGVSMDGFAENHDRVRMDTAGNPTFSRVQSNLLRMQEQQISVSALMVVTELTIKEDYSFLDWYEEHGISLKINPLLECGEAVEQNFSLAPGEYADYLTGAFRYYLQNEMSFSLQPISGMFNKVTHHSENAECTFSKNCMEQFLALDDAGCLYPCGRFCDAKAFSLGTIIDFKDSISEELSAYRKNSHCMNCRFQEICCGGCPFVTWQSGEINPFCQDYQKIFTFCISDALSLIMETLKKRRVILSHELEQKHEV